MVIETSALLAILMAEPEAEGFAVAIEHDPIRLISAGSVLETAIVAESRWGDAGGRELDLFLFKAGISVMPVDGEQVEIARQAFRLFGKGRHPAGLNFGDCFAYALSRVSGQPLLFKGDDFAHTDLDRVEVTELPD
jgi:ribonuclease VapC